MRSSLRSAIVISGALLFYFPFSAAFGATTLPAATANANVQYNCNVGGGCGPGPQVSGSASAAVGPYGGTSLITLSASSGPFIQLSAAGSNTGPAPSIGFGDYTAGYADLTYSVMISSADDLWVPYDYSGIATASVVSNGGLGRATSEIDINGNTALLVDSGCPNCGAQGAFDLKGAMQTNTVYTFYLKTYVDTMGPGQTAAYIDPYLTIDSDYLQSHPDLSLEFSDGVSNAPASASVPEPASWTMMIGGLGLVGGTMRRRKMAVSF